MQGHKKLQTDHWTSTSTDRPAERMFFHAEASRSFIFTRRMYRKRIYSQISNTSTNINYVSIFHDITVSNWFETSSSGYRQVENNN